MKDNKLIAVFKGHKVRNEHKSVIRFYDNPLQPWTVMAYDEVFHKLYTVPKEELYDYVVAVLFNKRKLWTTGSEIESLFSRIQVPYGKRHMLKEPVIHDTVCFIRDEYANELEIGKLPYSSISTLQDGIAKKINWLAPHSCLAVYDNISGEITELFITIPEYNTVSMSNPVYFDVKEKTR